jgi:hypothetical protein
MRNTDRLCDPAGIVDILARAAGTFPVGSSAMVVKLQGNSKHIIALSLQESSNDRGIHATRHGNDNPRFGRVSWKTERIEHHTIPEAPFKAAHGKQRRFYTRCARQFPERQTTPNNGSLTIMAKSRHMRILGSALRKTLSRTM